MTIFQKENSEIFIEKTKIQNDAFVVWFSLCFNTFECTGDDFLDRDCFRIQKSIADIHKSGIQKYREKKMENRRTTKSKQKQKEYGINWIP